MGTRSLVLVSILVAGCGDPASATPPGNPPSNPVGPVGDGSCTGVFTIDVDVGYAPVRHRATLDGRVVYDDCASIGEFMLTVDAAGRHRFRQEAVYLVAPPRVDFLLEASESCASDFWVVTEVTGRRVAQNDTGICVDGHVEIEWFYVEPAPEEGSSTGSTGSQTGDSTG